MTKPCPTELTFTFCVKKLLLNCEDSTDLSLGYNINKACGERDLKDGVSGDVGMFSIKLGLISSQAHAGRTCAIHSSAGLPPQGCAEAQRAAGWDTGGTKGVDV